MKKSFISRFVNRGFQRRLSGTTVLLASLAVIALSVQARSERKPSGIFYGEAQTVGAGTARSYVNLTNGVPVEIGFELSEGALQALPAGEKWHAGMNHSYKEYLLPLPREAEATPIKLLELDWNPGGHEPPGVYDVPHFDFHFYTISRAERDAINEAAPDYMKKAEHLPAPDLVPAGYFTPPPITPVPRMGVHWANRDAEELRGKPFTHTFIYGSWDGRMIFYEPMIAHSFLASKPDVTSSFPTAQCTQPSGYHPSQYSIRYNRDARTYRVSLSGFEFRGCDASGKIAVFEESVHPGL